MNLTSRFCGSSRELTGHIGKRLELSQELLSAEGVREGSVAGTWQKPGWLQTQTPNLDMLQAQFNPSLRQRLDKQSR